MSMMEVILLVTHARRQRPESPFIMQTSRIRDQSLQFFSSWPCLDLNARLDNIPKSVEANGSTNNRKHNELSI